MVGGRYECRDCNSSFCSYTSALLRTEKRENDDLCISTKQEVLIFPFALDWREINDQLHFKS